MTDASCQSCGGDVTIEVDWDTEHLDRPSSGPQLDVRCPVELQIECVECGLTGRLTDPDYQRPGGERIW